MQRTLAWVGALAFLVAASVAFGHELARTRYQAAAWRAEDHALVLRDSLRLTRAVVRVDSVEVERTVTRWRVVRDSLVDTLRLTDTVRVLIAAADTAVRTCTDALGRCQAALAQAQRLAAADSASRERMSTLARELAAAADREHNARWRRRMEGAAGVIALGLGTYYLVRE